MTGITELPDSLDTGPVVTIEPELNDLFDLSLEDLMQVEVTSGSRQSQPIGMSSVPVSLITSEDIRYSGRTNLADLLQFVHGMDVISAYRNRPMVGVRGLHD